MIKIVFCVAENQKISVKNLYVYQYKYYLFCDHDYLSVLNNNPPSSSPPHFYDEQGSVEFHRFHQFVTSLCVGLDKWHNNERP